jgi:uncharacterized membrane protein YhaH (DUF805 family)
MEWMLLPLKRYADFSGRSRRKEYWMFVLGSLILYAIVGGVFFALAATADGTASDGLGAGGIVAVLLVAVVALGLFIPSIAVQVRRFHDQDRSGWMVLLGFIPYVGGIIVLVFMCLDGTRGPNRFGPDPKAENLSDVFA